MVFFLLVSLPGHSSTNEPQSYSGRGSSENNIQEYTFNSCKKSLFEFLQRTNPDIPISDDDEIFYSGLLDVLKEFLVKHPECASLSDQRQTILLDQLQQVIGNSPEITERTLVLEESLISELTSLYCNLFFPLLLYATTLRYFYYFSSSELPEYYRSASEAINEYLTTPTNTTGLQRLDQLKNCFLQHRKSECAYSPEVGAAISIATSSAMLYTGWQFLLHPEWTPSNGFLVGATAVGVVNTAWWGNQYTKAMTLGLGGLKGVQLLSGRFYSMQATGRFSGLMSASLILSYLISSGVALSEQGYWYIFSGTKPYIFYTSLALSLYSMYQYLTHRGVREERLILLGQSTVHYAITAFAAIGSSTMNTLLNSRNLGEIYPEALNDRWPLIVSYGSVTLMSMISADNAFPPLLLYTLVSTRMLSDTQIPLFDRPENFDPLGYLLFGVLMPVMVIMMNF
jgi:hypothetical protein